MKIIQFKKPKDVKWFWEGTHEHLYNTIIKQIVVDLSNSEPNMHRELLYLKGIPIKISEFGGVMHFDTDGYWDRIEFKNDADYTWFILRWS